MPRLKWFGFVLLACVICYSLPVEGKVIYVKGDAQGDGGGVDWANACTSISAGLIAATTDDEIWVAAGRYVELVTMKENVDLYGGFWGSETARDARNWIANETIIDASGTSSPEYFSLMIAVRGANDAILDGFTITGGSSYYGCGVLCSESSPTLSNCTITGNSNSGWASGINFQSKSSASLTNCIIAGNAYGGVYCSESSPTLTNCLIAENTDGSGIQCLGSSSPKLVHCTIANNAEGGIYCQESSPRLRNCILWNPGEEIRKSVENSTPLVLNSCIQGGWEGAGNISEYPRFADYAKGDYHLQDHSPCIDAGSLTSIPSSDLEGNPRPGADGLVDMGAYEAPDAYTPQTTPKNPIVYVRANAGVGGDGSSWEKACSTIQSALEFSRGGEEIWVAAGTYPGYVTMEPTVSLYGGFQGGETSRNERDWTANTTIIDASGANHTAVLDANDAMLDGFTVTGGLSAVWGGGVACRHSSFILAHCRITGNQALGYGGGVACYQCSPTLTHCIISNNTADQGWGGGFACVTFASAPKLTNCIIAGNTAKYGGGVYCDYYSYPVLTNCTIYDNTAQEGAGGYSGDYASLKISNSILWGDQSTEISLFDETSYANITWSLIQGGYEGEGNIDGDPRFTHLWDGTSADLHLLADSPCIDAGKSGSPFEDGDLPPGLGTSRGDMGAYGGPFNGGWTPQGKPSSVPCWPLY